MHQRLPLLLAATALVVAVLAATPIAGAMRAAVLPKDSVGTTQLRANAVTGPKIRNGTVTALDVRKGTLTSAQVRDGSLLAADFRAGQLPAGPRGEQGEKGDPGATTVVVRRSQTSLEAAGLAQAVAACTAGETLVGGGSALLRAGDTLSADANVDVVASFPAATGITPPADGAVASRWVGVARVAAPSSSRLVVFASCARP